MITCLFVSCNSIAVSSALVDVADLVVYGKVFTSVKDGKGNYIADAFAVKNGKFIYVGDENNVAAYIKEGKTRIIDHRDKGIIIPGCYESHAHYLMANSLILMGGSVFNMDTDFTQFKQAVETAYSQAKAAGKSSIYGFGWFYQKFLAERMPTRQDLDAICPDIALFVNDAEGHKGLANTKCLQNAGIINDSGDVLISQIRGGEICMTDGKPNGLLTEQAATYVRTHGINFNEIFPASLGKQTVEKSQEQLLANGYVSYMDGWSNSYGNNSFYEGAKTLDKADNLHMLLGLSYEFDSSVESVEEEIAKAKTMKQYTGGHINADFVKIFIDGTVESGTGLTTEPYQERTFGNGIANWTEEEVKDITGKVNGNGMTMHVHTMGDAAVNRAVNAFVDKGNKELRNTVVHARNVPEADFRRMAENNIVAVSGILWHAMGVETREILAPLLPENLLEEGCPVAYPMKSFFNAGAVMTSHSDYPATSGSPNDPFGIMEIAVTGQILLDGNLTEPFWTRELISREEALQALTINGAYQMHVENERGSIEVGKYADFVLADLDVLACPESEIHNAKVLSTWFEGKKVYGYK